MDTMKKIRELTGKYNYVLLVILAGLALMLLPNREAAELQTPDPEIREEIPMAASLETILEKIQGVGSVKVLLTEAQGMRTVYVFDESTAGDSQKSDAVIITDGSREQRGLVCQVMAPVYQGAVVVCQGGDNPAVRLAVVEAVCDATGLSADKITVLKMK